MRVPERRDGQEGQVVLALLLVVVVLLFGALALGQLGSAADQNVQAGTAVDAAAVAAAQELLRDAALRAPEGLPPGLAAKLGAFPPPGALPAAAGCDAAQRNWEANSHRSGLPCSDVQLLEVTPDRVRMEVDTPPGELVSGPAGDVSQQRATSRAAAAVTFTACPSERGLLGAVLRALVDATGEQLDLPARCRGRSELEHLLDALLTPPAPSPAPSPSPSPTGAPPSPSPSPSPSPAPTLDLGGFPDAQTLYREVARSFRVQLVE